MVRLLLAVSALVIVQAGPVAGQETDDSPGLLSAAHAGLDNPDSCDSCHNDAGEVEGERCLVCHDLIGDRIAAKKGVHRDVTVDDCATCHAEHGGRDVDLRPLDRESFDHAAETGFVLEGYHDEFRGDCARCHTSRSFLTLNTKCVTCHEDVHKGTLGGECTTCHAVDAHFKNASRAFHKSTLLPLEGRHLDVPCADCHWDGQLKGTPTRCYDCHWIRRQDDPNRTRLGNECENCHRPISWTAVTWDHAYTGQPLNVPHRTVDCDGCHPGRRYDGAVPADCYSCHSEDYASTEDPNHGAAGFPTDCTVCHSPNDPTWGSADFVHPYQLVGVHATLDCASCHAGGVYQGTPTDCVGCHQDDYDASQNPNHAAAGFPTTCDSCHQQTDPDWHQASYPHTVYPLVGAHLQQECTSCHTGTVYQGLPSECVDCHLDDYNATADPNHATAGFPTTCEVCHTPTAWTDGHFDHPFQLEGVHATLDCLACHAGGYQGTPTECVGCHQDDYDNAVNPNHVAAGFPTTCELCHNPADSSWNQGTFSHPYFPIDSGAHAGVECSSCHINPMNFGIFSCISGGCHPRGRTDDDHDEVPGYVYDSAACYSCHPDGQPPELRTRHRTRGRTRPDTVRN